MILQEYILVFLITTLAGIYGLIFGGGSHLTLPFLFLLGIDPKIAIATNQVGAIGQLSTGSYVFIKNKKIHWDLVKWVAPAYLIGALIGVFVLIQIDGLWIKKIVSAAIVAFAFLTLFKNPEKQTFKSIGKEKRIIGFLVAIAFGIYSIVITASIGTMLTFLLMYMFGLSFKSAVQNRQVMAVIGIVPAVILLWINGYVDPLLAIPLLAGRIVGGYIGATIVMKSKSHFLRIIFSIVIIALALKTFFF
ncbi:sulfite exporter TauE/SafE family protein [Candidatus Pacearchaeota archaeon]|nr:sulfite exporter TauE/SafE family protein [Candidatus Pacearchaeota archaeon]